MIFGFGSGDSAYSDEFGISGESVYSSKSGYFGLSGGSVELFDSCESDNLRESGNFCEYYYSRKSDQSGVCRLSDQYGWSGDSGKSHDFGDSGDYCSKCDIRKNFNTNKCLTILV